ncbi:host attachment family protein [Salaquimonas pukyongi]|uniref:host attachment family protein n=1 Tax=Salaquimonas pukyongi TaxID=2712698 RepID=UPI00096BCC4B|nr:host attachment family protein [Salaquimonas pukyongi]
MGDIRLPRDGWIVVADGEKALFLRNEGDAKFPNLAVFREMEQENPPTREQAANRPGRFNDGPSAHKSAVADTDWHEFEKTRFAREIAAKLYELAHKGKFSALVLAAPPKILGELRDEMHQEVAHCVIGEVDKTLTNHPVHEIEKLLLATG